MSGKTTGCIAEILRESGQTCHSKYFRSVTEGNRCYQAVKRWKLYNIPKGIIEQYRR